MFRSLNVVVPSPVLHVTHILNLENLKMISRALDDIITITDQCRKSQLVSRFLDREERFSIGERENPDDSRS